MQDAKWKIHNEIDRKIGNLKASQISNNFGKFVELIYRQKYMLYTFAECQQIRYICISEILRLKVAVKPFIITT